MEIRPLLSRYAGRGCALAASLLLAWPGNSALAALLLIPSFSPFVAVSAALAARSPGPAFLLAIPALALAIITPRGFCRHACPVGLLLEPGAKLRRRAGSQPPQVPRIGPWLALLSLGGACVGTPLFLWLDPLAMLNAFLCGWRQPLAVTALLAAAGLPLLLLVEWLLPRAWCSSICPLGATQDLLAAARRGRTENRKVPSTEPEPWHGPQLARRGLLGLFAGAACAGLARSAGARPDAPIRPPGAIEEERFRGVCVRCGNCARVCPSGVIRPDAGSHGILSFLTPALQFAEDYCREDCRRCTGGCPSGALAPLTLESKRQSVIGTAMLDPGACLLVAGMECTACIRRCPYEAMTIGTGEDGFSSRPRIDTGRCNGCGACEAACPVRPQRAIRVRKGDAGRRASVPVGLSERSSA